MTFVGSGYLIALADPSDQHRRARSWNAFVTDRLIATEYVLVETMNALSGFGYRERAHTIARTVMAEERFNLVESSRDLLNAGLDLHHLRPDKEWSLTDCISFHVMEQGGIRRALAFDHHFEQAGFEALLRRDPPPTLRRSE